MTQTQELYEILKAHAGHNVSIEWSPHVDGDLPPYLLSCYGCGYILLVVGHDGTMRVSETR